MYWMEFLDYAYLYSEATVQMSQFSVVASNYSESIVLSQPDGNILK